MKNSQGNHSSYTFTMVSSFGPSADPPSLIDTEGMCDDPVFRELICLDIDRCTPIQSPPEQVPFLRELKHCDNLG